MRQTTSRLKNENGAIVIVTAIMILVLISIIGFSSVNISKTEVQIAGHESSYQQNFYNAESANLETIELLENIADLKTAGLAWLEPNIDIVTEAEIQGDAFWQAGNGTVTPQASASLPAGTQYVALSEGVISGSLGMGSTKVHAYTIYGRAAPPNRGQTIIQMGYLKASK